MNMNGGGFQRQSQSQSPEDVAVTVHPLPCTLEELYLGKRKKMKVNRKGRNGTETSKVLEIDVKPGWKSGTKITFKNEGDADQYGRNGTVQFVVEQKPHSVFERDGSDLIHNMDVPL